MLLSSGKIANNPNMGHSNGGEGVYAKAPWRKQHGHLEAPGPGRDVRKAVRPRACQTGCRACTLECASPKHTNDDMPLLWGPSPHDHRGATQRPEEPLDSLPQLPTVASHGAALLSGWQGNKRLFHGRGRLCPSGQRAAWPPLDRHWPRLCCPLSSTPSRLREPEGDSSPTSCVRRAPCQHSSREPVRGSPRSGLGLPGCWCLLWFPIGSTGIRGRQGPPSQTSQKHPKMQVTHELGIGLLNQARRGGPCCPPSPGEPTGLSPQRAQHGPEGAGLKL